MSIIVLATATAVKIRLGQFRCSTANDASAVAMNLSSGDARAGLRRKTLAFLWFAGADQLASDSKCSLG